MSSGSSHFCLFPFIYLSLSFAWELYLYPEDITHCCCFIILYHLPNPTQLHPWSRMREESSMLKAGFKPALCFSPSGTSKKVVSWEQKFEKSSVSAGLNLWKWRPDAWEKSRTGDLNILGLEDGVVSALCKVSCIESCIQKFWGSKVLNLL